MKGEVVLIRLFEVGRHIDLQGVTAVFPGKPDILSFESKDTPVIYLPKPLALELPEIPGSAKSLVRSVRTKIKLYEDGVVSLVGRVAFHDVPLEHLQTLCQESFETPDGSFNLDQWLDKQFAKLYPGIRSHVDEDYYKFDPLETESYTVFCIHDDLGTTPEVYTKQHAQVIAKLLMGVHAEMPLHQSQITATLDKPFAFLEKDMTLFDYDHCLIFDPRGHYEDTLFVAELANYEMLALRCIDRILDQHLDAAEDDIRKIFLQNRAFSRKLSKKLSEWVRLRYDVLFILENLENVSKIIGNFHLGNQYKHLCDLFELSNWLESIRSRLETLGEIYTMAHDDLNDRLILIIEVFLAFIFVWEFVMVLVGLG